MNTIALLSALFLTVAAQAIAQTPIDSLPPELLQPSPVPRLALVVGVEHYDFFDRVPNARNDAAEVAAALKAAGFTWVNPLIEPSQGELMDAVRDLAHRAGSLGQPSIVVVYFAGHGFQNGAFNFVVPAEAARDTYLDQSVPVTSILLPIVKAQGGLAILFLDACRTTAPRGVDDTRQQTNAPLGVDAAGQQAKGFATVAAPSGAVVMSLAAGFGTPALSAAHEGATNSPYASALVSLIPKREMSLSRMLDRVRVEVRDSTNLAQSSETLNAGSASSFYFVKGESQRSEELDAWMKSLQSGRVRCIQKYIDLFPDSPFLRHALRIIVGDLELSAFTGEGVCDLP